MKSSLLFRGHFMKQAFRCLMCALRSAKSLFQVRSIRSNASPNHNSQQTNPAHNLHANENIRAVPMGSNPSQLACEPDSLILQLPFMTHWLPPWNIPIAVHMLRSPALSLSLSLSLSLMWQIST